MWIAIAIVLLAFAVALWLARQSRLRNFASPERCWDTLVEFWRGGHLAAVRSCLTPESRELLAFVREGDRPPPHLPQELVRYLIEEGGENAGVYEEQSEELLRAVRSNIEKFWFRARPRGAGETRSEEERRTELGLLRHIFSGIPDDDARPVPRVARILQTRTSGRHDYVRVVHEPMFAGFGLVDTFKRTGRVWLLDLAAPLLEAAHASKTQFKPGDVVKLTDRVMMREE